jgi:Uncharacterized protein conserved in bacteria (DUF2325)
MSHSNSLDRFSNGYLLSRPQPLAQKFDVLLGEGSTLRQLGERKISGRAEESTSAPPGRRKIWDFVTHFHCSIIGTCLSTAELRHILIKLGRQEAETASEHDLHASGVLIASQRHEGAKLLHKALDRRHRVSINRFDKAKTTEEVRAAWKEAVQRGEIPGAYWAALSHPATNDGLLREIFADVHMLSHLVGAANRADIRRLRQLEDENAELEAKVGRQQQQLRDAIVSRDATIRELRCALEERIVDDRDSIAQYSSESDSAMWVNFVADLKRRLATVESHCERLEGELAECRSALAAERDARAETEKQDKELRQELDEVEASLADIAEVNNAKRQPPRLSNLTLLYVGGRQAQIGHLRVVAERSGAIFLHHDGGIEERSGLLQGLISRADAVLFPVDCISHTAMSLIKRTCRQSDKPFLPLRGAGLAPFCAALNKPTAFIPPSLPQDGA